MQFRTVVIAVALAILAGAVKAAERLVVVELFTSQGCSSCPPADAILAELTERSDVLPLALHVDYWDYLGWKDDFASPAYTQRQRRYARASGHRTVYTPQIVVAGTDHVIGNKPMKLVELINRHARREQVVDLELTREGKRVEIVARALSPQPGRYSILLVTYRPSETVKIGRGENAGRTILYKNIVLSLTEVGRWNGRDGFRMKAPVPAGDEIAVLIQSEGEGPILAAARAR